MVATNIGADVRAQLKVRLGDAFGMRLRAVVLYGSRARGAATPDSDMDLMVVLAGPVRLGRDIETIVRAIYPIQLEAKHPIHAMPVDESDFSAQEYAVYRRAHAEGVPL